MIIIINTIWFIIITIIIIKMIIIQRSLSILGSAPALPSGWPIGRPAAGH